MLTRDRSLCALAVIAFLGAAPLAAGAEDAAPAEPKPSDNPIKLTPAEQAEKESRKACKIAICSAMHDKQDAGTDISCNIVKSWRKTQLTKLVAKLKVTWPYGPAHCTSDVNLDRTELVKAVSGDKEELQLEKHSVHCVVDREKQASTEITFEFSPKVMFEKGKAIKAQMNWGKIQAPMLLKSALWTATAADNKINILSGTLVDDINDFISKKCAAVKDGK